MYDNHLRLIGNRVVDFILVLIELFSLGVTAEALRAIICSKSAISLQQGLVDPKFQVASTNHSFFQKTRLNDFSHGMKYGQIFLRFCHNASILQTDRQTDRGTDGRADRISSEVKI